MNPYRQPQVAYDAVRVAGRKLPLPTPAVLKKICFESLQMVAQGFFMGPRFATVILYFNKPSLTLRCLRSVLEAHTSDHSIILVDNGSMPHHRLEVEAAALELQAAASMHVSLSLLSVRENQGFAAGMNAGLRAAFSSGAELVTALCNDVELSPDFFERLSDLANHGTALSKNGIYCPTVFHAKKRDALAFSHASVDPRTLELFHHAGPAPSPLKFPHYYPAAAMVWTKSAFETLGGFDENYFCYWEDVSLSFYASMKGVDLLPAPSLRVHHLGRGTTGSKKIYTRHFAEGRARFKELL